MNSLATSANASISLSYEFVKFENNLNIYKQALTMSKMGWLNKTSYADCLLVVLTLNILNVLWLNLKNVNFSQNVPGLYHNFPNKFPEVNIVYINNYWSSHYD